MANCKSCGAEIIWQPSVNGRPTPMSVKTGENHFADCPQSKQWSGTKRLEAEPSLFDVDEKAGE